MQGRQPENTHKLDCDEAVGALKSEMFLKLEMKSNPEALCLVRATIERAAELLHFPDDDTRAIVRSVDEALANVLRHAYKGETGRPVEMVCRSVKGNANGTDQPGMEILLEDEGIAADPAQFKGRELDDLRPGGLGLHFINQSMDEVEFRRNQGKNQLRMVKYLSQAPQGTGSEGEK